MSDAANVIILYDAILAAVTEVEKELAFSRGDAMSAAVHFIVETGLCEPADTAEQLMREANAALVNAIKDWQTGVQ
jgi:hypothetical protein